MTVGKKICETLKKVRLDIARANDIDYTPTPCNHKGDCDGTCPACESEVRYLERQLARRRAAGKVALVAGISLGVSALLTPAEAQNTINRPSGGKNVNGAEGKGSVSTRTRGVPAKRPRPKEKDERPLRGKVTMPGSCDTTKTDLNIGYPDVIVTEPIFPGGEEVLTAFVTENLRFPEGVEPQEGTLLLLFKVDEHGKANSPHVAESSLPDEYGIEAMRLVGLMPAFIPGTLDGVVQEQWYSVPVCFKLPK